MSERIRTSDNSVLQLVKGKDENIKNLPLEDGRLSFAVDSKKIYLDCDFTDSMGDTYNDRLAFGGSSGIYYGVRNFTADEIENREYIFSFPDQFDIADEEIPSIDDLILNNDGCFYRVIEINTDEEEILISTTKLTVAGSGGGSGSGVSSGLIVAKDPNQNYNIIAANNSIPINFKVTDSLSNTSIDVEVTINGVTIPTVFHDVTQNEYTTIDLKNYSGYFVKNSANTVILRFTNEYDHAAQLTLRNIRLIDLEVRLDQTNLGVKTTSSVNLNIKPYGASTMYDRFINISVHKPGQLNTDVAIIPFNATIDNGETYVYTISDLYIEGNYTVDIWLTAHATPDDQELLSSPKVVASFIYKDASSNVPILSASIDAYEFNQYDTATVEYLIAYEGVPSSVHLSCYKDDELTPYAEQFAQVSNNTPHEWKVILTKAGTYKFIVAIDSYGLQEIIDGVVVGAIAAEVPYIDTEDASLQLYLDASGRSNNETTPNIWAYKNIECQFENFNWNTNGWKTDENNSTSLHLTNGAKLTVPFAIFSAANTENLGAQATGKTIEINFKISNVRDINSVLINAASWWNGKLNTGIVGTGDKICMNTKTLINYRTPEEDALLNDSERAATNGLRAYLAEDTRIHVAFAIQQQSVARLIYTYVNGVLSGLTMYEDASIQDAAANAPSYLRFDSTDADIDIYSIRVYGKYCADSILLNNYAADLPTIEQKLFVKENNDVLNNGEISLQRVQELGNIPYLVVTDLRKTGDKKGNLLDADDNIIGSGPEGTTKAITIGKKDFRWAPCYYVDPQHPDRNFGDPTHLVEAVMYGQGTSSLAYPVKNFRLRFKNKADKYSLLPAVPTSTEEEQTKWENMPKVALFTMKADYMDSSMAHNTGTGNVLAALYDSINLKTAAQINYPDKTICTNIVGCPIICFWRPGDIGTETYIGRYNFNTDKAEHSLFGFQEDGMFGRVCETVNGVKQLKWGFQSTTDESKDWDANELYNKTYYTQPIHEAQYEWSGNGLQDGGKAMKTALGQGPLYEYVEGPRSIQCWEFLNNASALNGFRQGWDGDLNEWVAGFESRYPEHQETKIDADHKYQFCSDNRAFARLINWLHSTDQSQAFSEAEYVEYLGTNNYYLDDDTEHENPVNKWAVILQHCATYIAKLTERAQYATDSQNYKDLTDEIAALRTGVYANDIKLYDRYAVAAINSAEEFTPVTINNRVYNHNTKEYRLAKFTNEFDNYMDKNFTIFYYIITEVLLMIDSRGKNMMMCSYDLDSDAGTGHWFPIFYDMDTILGVDNSGVLRYSYDVADEDEMIYNASANYGHYDKTTGEWIRNPNYSTLWCNLREAFGTDIKTMYNNLRKEKFNLEYLLQSYNDTQADAFAEIYDNKDGWYKYIRPLTEETTVTVNGVTTTKTGINWIHAEQGTRSLHRKYFLSHRFAYLDSKYATGANGTEDIFMRINFSSDVNVHPNPHSSQFTLTSQSAQYGATKFGGNGTLISTKLEPNIPTMTAEPPTIDTVSDLETYIFNIGDIYDLGDLSDKFLLMLQFNKVTKLRSLKLGNADASYKSSKSISISGLYNENGTSYLPLLERLDIQHAKLQTLTLNLSACPYFKELYAIGSNITALNCAPGGNIQHLELPRTIADITLRDNLFYKSYDNDTNTNNLIIEGYENLSSINIQGCPYVDTFTLMSTIMNQDNTEYGQIVNIRLPDVNWHIDTISSATCDIETLEVDGQQLNVIQDIKVLNYIYNIPNGYTENNSPISSMDVNNEYFGGTIYINNDDYYVNDLFLKNKYKYKFPNLQIVYSNQNNIIAGYTINIINADTDEAVPKTQDKKNSMVIDAVEANGFNLKEYLENDVSIPDNKPSSPQWVYNFKGWTTVKTWTTDGGLKSSSIEEINAALATGYSMTFDELTGEWTTSNAPTELPLTAFTDKVLNLYPVYLMTVRNYTVTFMLNEDGSQDNSVWSTIELPYGSSIQMPAILPSVLTLDPNDKSHTTIRTLITYAYNNKQYSDYLVNNDIVLYPVYSNSNIDMRQMYNPPFGYFSVSDPIVTEIFDGSKSTTFNVDGIDLSMASYGIVVTIKAEVTNQAICVPKMIGDKYVIALKNESPYVKRIYFEEGCPIRYFLGNSGFNGTFDDPIDGQHVSGFTLGMNSTLEFIDLTALTQLHTIGVKEVADVVSTDQLGDSAGADCVFAGCPNLEIGGLPDSVTIIGKKAFAYDTSLVIPKMPRWLIAVQKGAFCGCTGLGTIEWDESQFIGTDLNSICTTHNSSAEITIENYWPIICENAFRNCSSLNFVYSGNVSEQNGILLQNTNTFNGLASIQSYAFAGCTSLVFLATTDLENYTLRNIGLSAFMGDNHITLAKLPVNIEKIDSFAFANCGNIRIGTIPFSLISIGSGVFYNDNVTNYNNCHIIWYVSPETTGSVENNTIRSAVVVADDAFNKLVLNNEVATLFINLPNGDKPWRTYEPWITVANDNTKALGAKRIDNTAVDVVFWIDGNPIPEGE